ncbi:hypothetical protein GUJ93_ZPchr0001g30782 [Zizania palustris]|uniref:Uncharacterized protein n=1 Tax=Zizania palustris TaxID=103762 RepID=A0A8J5RQM8_ZIZPA|nr:hypothetical protein GUJ93_ZPchr0001g30782 [Zizania palustris]
MFRLAGATCSVANPRIVWIMSRLTGRSAPAVLTAILSEPRLGRGAIPVEHHTDLDRAQLLDGSLEPWLLNACSSSAGGPRSSSSTMLCDHRTELRRSSSAPPPFAAIDRLHARTPTSPRAAALASQPPLASGSNKKKSMMRIEMINPELMMIPVVLGNPRTGWFD